MIQRIQTIWLLLATLTICCLFFIPVVTAADGAVSYKIIASGLYKTAGGETTQIESYLALMISTIATALMCFVNIFNFKKRTAQKRIILANISFMIGLAFWNNIYAKKIPGGSEVINYSLGAILPIIAILFAVLALKGIVNDEKLLRSADRLR